MTAKEKLSRVGIGMRDLFGLFDMVPPEGDAPARMKTSEELSMAGTQVDTQVSETDLVEVVGNFNERVDRLEGLMERMFAREQEYMDAREAADVEIESPAGTQAPEVNEPIRDMREGEMAFGILRKAQTDIQGQDFPTGSLVTAYLSAQGKSYKRVWNEETSRLLAKATWNNKGLVKRVPTPAKQLENEQEESVRKAQVKALNEYRGETVVYLKGTKISRTSNGKAMAKTPDSSRPTFVGKKDVTKGKLNKDIVRTYFPDGLTKKVTRHMKGLCTCAPLWPCPAVQILGPDDALVGEHEYTLRVPRKKAEECFAPTNIGTIDLEGKSAKRYLAKHLSVWNLGS